MPLGVSYIPGLGVAWGGARVRGQGMEAVRDCMKVKGGVGGEDLVW